MTKKHKLMDLLENKRFDMDGKRMSKGAQIAAATPALFSDLDGQDGQSVSGMHYRYEVGIELGADEEIHDIKCTCLDFLEGKHKTPIRVCKHVIALAQLADADQVPGWGEGKAQVVVAPIKVSAEVATQSPFNKQVGDSIGKAIARLAAEVRASVDAGNIPLLLGPTGAGKTSAVRAMTVAAGWGFEEVAGSASWADADLVGIRTGKMELPGIFARAFRRARAGEIVTLFFDEFLRFNVRSMDILMRPLQITPAVVAKAMGIFSDEEAPEDIRLVEAPLWGQEWAPAKNVRIALATNPWGANIDPALIRRVTPIQVEMDKEVLKNFAPDVQKAINISWEGAKTGRLPLPIEYQAMSTASGPDDRTIVDAYINRLKAVDMAAANGYIVLTNGATKLNLA